MISNPVVYDLSEIVLTLVYAKNQTNRKGCFNISKNEVSCDRMSSFFICCH